MLFGMASELGDPKTLVEVFEEHPELMGERGVDPFRDDTPLECGVESPEVCDSCQ